MERTVTVWGRPQTVKIDQSSRTSWSAKGEYGGRMLFSNGATAAAAAAKWQAAATALGQKRA